MLQICLELKLIQLGVYFKRVGGKNYIVTEICRGLQANMEVKKIAIK